MCTGVCYFCRCVNKCSARMQLHTFVHIFFKGGLCDDLSARNAKFALICMCERRGKSKKLSLICLNMCCIDGSQILAKKEIIDPERKLNNFIVVRWKCVDLIIREIYIVFSSRRNRFPQDPFFEPWSAAKRYEIPFLQVFYISHTHHMCILSHMVSSIIQR